MTTPTRLKGITWDHPRGYDPLAGSLAGFRAAHPDIEVSWERRSLRDFGEAPIDVLADRVDLIVVDHPFSGRAQASGRSEEHTSELQSLMRISYAVFCLKKKQ